MKLLAVLAFIAALAFAPKARADEAAAAAARAPKGEASARIDVGYGTLVVHAKDNVVHQTRFTIAPEFAYKQRLKLAPFVRLTTTDIELLQKDSMAFDASLALPWQPSLGARLSYDAFRIWKLHLIAVGEFEFPLGENRAWINSFTPKDKIADLQIDVDALRNHVSVDHRWRSVQGALRLQLDLGWVRPYADLGYMSIDSRLAVNFDATAASLLKDANLKPDRHYNGGADTPYYMLGSEFELGRGFRIRLNGTMIPTSDKNFYTGEVFVSFPLF